MKRVLLLALLLMFGLGAVVAQQVLRWWQSPHPAQVEATIVIAPGSSLRAVAQLLVASNVLTHGDWWQWAVRLQQLDHRVKSGEYLISATESPARVLQILLEGQVVQYSVTLPEGITLTAALGILQRQPVLLHELADAADQRLLQLVAPYTSAEGQFFPDTYVYARGDSDWDVLQQAHQRLQAELAAAWQNRAEGLPYKNPYQALVMASIVEKETAIPAERPTIAGVFVRRLQQRMRLQTDPTVIYGLGASFDGNLTRRHLKDASNLYNTYRHHGLPPGPIALVGVEALHAATHPAAGTALYFVARGDGSHVFSDTLADHQAAVRAYQLQRRKDYRSTP
jgi:UPF0755 protein